MNIISLTKVKKTAYAFFMCCMVIGTAIAQPPQYATVIHTNNLCFPIGSSSSYFKTQFLYVPGDFTSTLPTGNITKIYLSPNNSPAGSITITNLTIKIGMTSLTTLPTSSVYVTGLTTAYTAATTVIPQTPNNTWTTPIVLQTAVPYTNGQNFIVEIEHTGYTGSAFCLSAFNSSVTPSIRRTIYGPAGSTTGGGGFDNWFGDLGLDISTGPPCPAPTGLGASGILSTSATISWNAVAGSAGYEYVVNTTAANPASAGAATSLTSLNAGSLIPATTYYLHVRNKCSATNFSPWVTYSFNTLPPCKPPVNFKVTNLTPASATINWATWLSALSYDYIVDQSNATPSSSATFINTASTSANLSGLTEDTWYYVHIRSKCAAGEQSNWSLDSFLTPVLCRPPAVNVDHINTDQAVVYWAPVRTALYYEYAITTSPTPPALGTKYNFTTLHTSALDDGKEYYFHVRSHCSSLNIETTSDWGTKSFKTFPTTIKNTAGSSFNLVAYPNPVKDKMTLKVIGGDADASITITEVSGRVLQQFYINSTSYEVDLSSYAPGVYLVKYNDQSHHEVIQVSK